VSITTAEKLFHAIGRRKRAVARVYVEPGKGKRTINEKDIKDFFRCELHERTVELPLELLNVAGLYNIRVSVSGGGSAGQAGAIQLGVSRCLAEIDEKSHKALRDAGLLTRDSREVERKKYGRSGARKRYQFSKR